jgi:hypothetical protein
VSDLYEKHTAELRAERDAYRQERDTLATKLAEAREIIEEAPGGYEGSRSSIQWSERRDKFLATPSQNEVSK